MKLWKKEAKDQGAHALAGAVVVWAAEFSQGADVSIVAAMLIALAPGIVREFTEGQCARAEAKRFWESAPPHLFEDYSRIPGGSMRSWGSIRDYCGWMLGGLIAGAI